VPSADTKNAHAWVARFDLPDAAALREIPTIVPQPDRHERMRQNVAGGSPCPEAGWWQTLAKKGSRRYFNVIRVDDTTDHGGVFVAGAENFEVEG
jgi:hypothetical protein